ncbi:PorP/SprF family type IX secretion system membrane protein [Winogradskyella aquimaris]|uniref:PorP/SprF family type IX secretion system membrane protein n=1 Tax=Winogradskyella aquimaris TaxID=864074 RepID=A0ABU5EM40_9FLAO|nr:PorP/SprF family type IX secretion system membrane protein [Winogradskyella aquimaris]MDY2586580.1 PorP/SprF family type IX secretion system membrane protein [Winogradskyella aquimaris]
MKGYIFILFTLTLSIQMAFSQQDDGVVSFDLPIRNSLVFNRYNINPTFTFVREQNKYITFNNKRQWVQFDNAPEMFLGSYSGRFSENIGAGVAAFQQNYGVLTTFGGLLNFAYNVKLNTNSNLTFGLNAAAYKSGVNTANVVTNFDDPSLQNVPENFLFTINPGINYGTEFLDFGISINNLVLYNIETSAMIEDDPKQSIKVHVMHTGFFDGRGFFKDTKFSGILMSEFRKDETLISGLATLSVPKGIWFQVGYNNRFGVSGGLGLNVTKNIALEYNIEKSIGELVDFGTSHEVTLAYRFITKKRYDYSGDEEVSGLFTKKRNKPIVKASEEELAAIRERAAERRAKAKLEREAAEKAKKEAEANALAEAQQKAKQLAQEKAEREENARIAREKAAEEAKILAEQKAKAEAERKAQGAAEAKAKLLAEQKAKEEAEAKARVQQLAEQKAREEAAEKARLLAEQKAREEAAEKERLLAEQKAKLEAERKAQEEAEAEAQLLAEQKAKEEAEARAKQLAEQKAREAATENERLLAEQKAEETSIENPQDNIGKTIANLTKEAESSNEQQNKLLEEFEKIVNIKDEDLKDLKEENDLSDQGIVVQPKPFKSVTAENNKLNAIKSDLDKVIEEQAQKIDSLNSLYEERFRTTKLDEVNLFYRKKIEDLELKQAEAKELRIELNNRLEVIKEATEFEKRRRIKRAAYDNEQDRYAQDRAMLQNIKRTTKPAETPYTSDDFDFGQVQSENIQILKNVKNTESGYYLIIAVHSDINKRNEFLTKVVASGRANVDFFYDVNTSKYYIYYSKFDSINAANKAMEDKGNRPYNVKMSLVKIEN